MVSNVFIHLMYHIKLLPCLQVGQFDESHGLSINSTLTRGYDETGRQVSLAEVQSSCNDTEICSRRPESATMSAPYMKIPPNQEFVIGVMMPVHRPGDSYFTCSREVGESSFQNLLALSYALDKVNGNDTVLPQIKLGEFYNWIKMSFDSDMKLFFEKRVKKSLSNSFYRFPHTKHSNWNCVNLDAIYTYFLFIWYVCNRLQRKSIPLSVEQLTMIIAVQWFCL